MPSSNRRYVMGVFSDEEKTVSAIRAMEDSPWQLDRVHSPFPSHDIFEALKLKKSRVGYFTLAGGIIGFITGLSLAVYTAIQWNLIVWGKPVVAWFPFIIVGFEFTILFSVFGNIIGVLIQSRLPEYRSLKRYDSRCSGHHFGVLASCSPGEEGRLTEFFKRRGGEVKAVE